MASPATERINSTNQPRSEKVEESTTIQTRVIPSGKIYRQKFDAEVQLVRSLEKQKSEIRLQSAPSVKLDEREPTFMSNIGTATRRKDKRIPVASSSNKEGMLDKRQLTWATTQSNDDRLENPIFFKFVESCAKEPENEDEEDVKVVEGLPDVIAPTKTNESSIIDKISKSRRKRHESILEDMRQQLAIIGNRFEPEITSVSEALIKKLAENDEFISQVFKKIEDDDSLFTCTLEELKLIWTTVHSQSEERKKWIGVLETELQEIEDKRTIEAQKTLSHYADKLYKISYLMTADLEKYLDSDSQQINQTLLANRRSNTSLHCRLLIANIERDKEAYSFWKKRLYAWRHLQIEAEVKRFEEFVNSDEVVNSICVADVKSELSQCLRELLGYRHGLIQSIKNLKPPKSTKAIVYGWNKDLTNVSKKIDEKNQEFYRKLHGEYEKICRNCLSVMEGIQGDLYERGICTEHAAKLIIEERCLPLLNSRQRALEHELEVLDKKSETEHKSALTAIKSLFKFTQGASHVWDVHDVALTKQERRLQEKLEESRKSHDTANQDAEANLDIVMDKMRQAPNEVNLKSHLKIALDSLAKIKDSYEKFHNEQLNVVNIYPKMIKSELENYEEALCKYFGISTNEPEKDCEVIELDDDRKFYAHKSKKEKRVKMEKSGNIVKEKESELREYEISDELIQSVKKAIRLNFLSHVGGWASEAVERSNSVVAAKMEELKAELDLRMHLHEPRPLRAELDVHNVRAAELVMHSERVDRHVRGVIQTLSDARGMYKNLSGEHNDLVNDFRRTIESLEDIFVKATKSSKLLALSSKLQEEQDRFMEIIRKSLRKFRQQLDDTLQVVRESNANFIKSFQLFSDGGNFCVDEVEDYRKQLEKLSHKIDSTEGFVMSDLEGIEAKRLEQLQRISIEFEDRFKHHMIDLLFIEKISRWLTNSQVKIKSEVALSNTEAGKLADYLDTLERRIDACERPNLDKENVTPTDLQESLISIFDAFKLRTVYLNCMKSEPVVLISLPAAVAVSKMKKAPSEASVTISVSAPVRAKQAPEDPTVVTIKNILNSQKKRFGSSAELDGEWASASGAPQAASREQTAREKSAKSNRSEKRAASARKDGGVKWDKKYLHFGECDESSEEKHFLGKVRKILRDSTDGLLTAADIYYRQKGNRAVTRPRALQDTFEQCADVVCEKLLSYFKQADEYHNHCVQEVRRQLERLEKLVEKVPACVIREVVRQSINEARSAQMTVSNEFTKQHRLSEQLRKQHESELRPTLGHPQAAENLTELRRKEEERRKEYLKNLSSHSSALQLDAAKMATNFLQDLADKSEKLLLLFDTMLCVDDLERGRVAATCYPTSELLRRKASGEPLEDVEDKNALPRGKRTWLGMSKTELTLPSSESKVKRLSKTERAPPETTASITTQKTTLPHTSTIHARDESFETYKKYFAETLKSIEDDRKKNELLEERWTNNWLTNVDKVKQLY